MAQNLLRSVNIPDMPMRATLLAIVAGALAPPFLAMHHPLAAGLLRSFFSGLCHQDVTRSFVVEGLPVAVCVRCLGIYSGAALAALIPLRIISGRRWLAGALLINVMDVAAESLHYYGNLPLPRFLLGCLLGMAAGAVLFSRQDNARLYPQIRS